MHTLSDHPDPTPPPAGERVAGPQGPEIGRGGPSPRDGGGNPPTAPASFHSSPSHPSPSQAFPLFSPSPSTADAILRDLGDPDHTFRGIAEEQGTTLEALSTWFARPDIAQRAANIESAIARRARFVAIASLTTGAKAMQASISEYLLAAKVREEEPSDEDIHPDPKRAELFRRQAEAARKATLVLLRIAKFDPSCPPSPMGARAGRWANNRPSRSSSTQTSVPTPHPTPSHPSSSPATSPRTQDSGLRTEDLSDPPPAGEVPSLRGGGGRPPESQPRDSVTAPSPSLTPLRPDVLTPSHSTPSHPSPSHPSPSHTSLPQRSPSSPPRTQDSGPRPEVRRGGTQDCLPPPPDSS